VVDEQLQELSMMWLRLLPEERAAILTITRTLGIASRSRESTAPNP